MSLQGGMRAGPDVPGEILRATQTVERLATPVIRQSMRRRLLKHDQRPVRVRNNSVCGAVSAKRSSHRPPVGVELCIHRTVGAHDEDVAVVDLLASRHQAVVGAFLNAPEIQGIEAMGCYGRSPGVCDQPRRALWIVAPPKSVPAAHGALRRRSSPRGEIPRPEMMRRWFRRTDCLMLAADRTKGTLVCTMRRSTQRR